MSRWTKETFKDYWRGNDAFDFWRKEWTTNEESYLNEFKQVISALRKFKWYSLLELGCGTGKNLTELRKAFPNRALMGFDINKAMLEEASSHKLRVRQVDTEYFKLGKIVDVILCYEHLQHLHPEAFKNAVKQITNNGCSVVLYEGYNGYDESVLKAGRGGRWSYDYKKYFPNAARFNEISLFQWLTLPGNLDSLKVEAAAKEQGVRILSSHKFAVGAADKYFHVRLATCSPKTIDELEK